MSESYESLESKCLMQEQEIKDLLQKIKLYEEALKELPKKIESYCRCHEDYKRREREDPTCQFHDARDFAEQFIKSALDKAKELK